MDSFGGCANCARLPPRGGTGDKQAVRGPRGAGAGGAGGPDGRSGDAVADPLKNHPSKTPPLARLADGPYVARRQTKGMGGLPAIRRAARPIQEPVASRAASPPKAPPANKREHSRGFRPCQVSDNGPALPCGPDRQEGKAPRTGPEAVRGV